MSARVELIALAAIAAGCASGDGPPALELRYDPTVDFDAVTLAWNHPVGDTTGYVVERRVAGGAFQAVATRAPWELVAFDRVDAVPEQVDLEYRVRVASDAQGKRSSNVATMHRGVRAPALALTNVDQPVPSCVLEPCFRPPFQLTLTNLSRAADALVLERRVVPPLGAAGDWIALPLPAGATSYFDADAAAWTDGARFEYRLTARRGAEASVPVVLRTPRAALAAPGGVTAVPIAGGIRLTFQNASSFADRIVIQRGAPGGSADFSAAVAPTATSYDDLGVPPGAYEYALSVFGDQHQIFDIGFIDRVSVDAVVPPPASAGVSAVPVRLPPGHQAARAPSGAFATFGFVRNPSGEFAFAPAVGAAPLTFTAPSVLVQGLLVDANGHPHLAYVEPPTASAPAQATVVHAWHDGVAWQREDVAQRTSPTLAGFDLGLDGTLHLAWSEDAFPLFWEVASRRGGAWVVEDISALFGGARAADVTLAGDDAGFPHLVDASEGAATHVFRDAAGWRSEVLSVSLDVSNDRAAALVGGAGRLWLVLQTAVFSPSFHFDFSVIERGPTGWGAREPLGSGASVAAARSADGAALAVAAKAVSGPFSGALWIRRIGATAERTWFADATSSFAVGFRPDGKAWVLDRLRDPVSDDLTATQVVVLFEEL